MVRDQGQSQRPGRGPRARSGCGLPSGHSQRVGGRAVSSPLGSCLTRGRGHPVPAIAPPGLGLGPAGTLQSSAGCRGLAWPPVPVPSGPPTPPAACAAKEYKHSQRGDKTAHCSGPSASRQRARLAGAGAWAPARILRLQPRCFRPRPSAPRPLSVCYRHFLSPLLSSAATETQHVYCPLTRLAALPPAPAPLPWPLGGPGGRGAAARALARKPGARGQVCGQHGPAQRAGALGRLRMPGVGQLVNKAGWARRPRDGPSATGALPAARHRPGAAPAPRCSHP